MARMSISSPEELSGSHNEKGPVSKGIERRASIVESCLVCEPDQRCCLSRAEWFREMRTIRVVGRQATIFSQGQRAEKVYALRRGWVQATHLMPNGKAVTHLFGPGSIFGIDCAAAQCEFPYTAVAIEECELEEAISDDFLKRLREDPLIAVDVLRQVSQSMQRLLSRFYSSASKVRSAELLLETLREIAWNCSTCVDESTIRINLPLSVQVLADHIGCSRQWVSKMLASLENDGTIQRNGVWIMITPNDGSTRQ